MTSSCGLTFFCLLALAFVARAQKPQETLLGLPPLPAYFEDDEPTTVEKPVTTTPKPKKTVNPFTLPHPGFTMLPPHRNFLFPDAPYLVNNIPELPPQPESKYKGRYDDDGVFHPDDEEPKESPKEKKAQAHGAKIQKTEDSEEEADTDAEGFSREFPASTTPATTPEPMQEHLPIKKLSALREHIRPIGESTPLPSTVPEEITQETTVEMTVETIQPPKPKRKMVQVVASEVGAERPHAPRPVEAPRQEAAPQQELSPNAIEDAPKPVRVPRRRGFVGRRLQPQARRRITTIVPQTQRVASFDQDNQVTESVQPPVTRKVHNTHPELRETNLTRTTTQLPPRRRPHGSRPFRREIHPKTPAQRRLNENRGPPTQQVAQPGVVRKDVFPGGQGFQQGPPQASPQNFPQASPQNFPHAQPLPPVFRRPLPPQPPPRPQVQLPPQPPGRRPEDAAFMRELEEYDWGVLQRVNSRTGGRAAASSQPTFGNNGDARFLKELQDYDDIDILEHQKHFTDNPPQLRVNLPTTTLSPIPDRQELVPLQNSGQQGGNGNQNFNNFNNNNNFNGNNNGFGGNNNNFNNGFGNQGGQAGGGDFLHNIFNPNVFNQGGQGFFNGGGLPAVTPHPLLNVFNLFTFPQGRR
uniref:Extensin-like n=1 Tax=Steinernema glaseri TaxID=37863 RepID=A0A1I7Y185_9BILA